MKQFDDQWYGLELGELNSVNLVFNDAHGAQTENLRRDSTGAYEPGVGWTNGAPREQPNVDPTSTPSPEEETTPLGSDPEPFPRGDHLFPDHHPFLRRRPDQQLLLPRPHPVRRRASRSIRIGAATSRG